MGFFTDHSTAWAKVDLKNQAKKRRKNPDKKNYKRPEGIITDDIMRFLKEKNFLVMKLNSQVTHNLDTGNFIQNYFIANNKSSSGAPDIFAWNRFIHLLLEVKSSTGRQSSSQKAFEELCKSLNIDYYLVRSVDDVKNILKEYTWLKMLKRYLQGFYKYAPDTATKSIYELVTEFEEN